MKQSGVFHFYLIQNALGICETEMLSNFPTIKWSVVGSGRPSPCRHFGKPSEKGLLIWYIQIYIFCQDIDLDNKQGRGYFPGGGD
jgi:hypothetical protein